MRIYYYYNNRRDNIKRKYKSDGQRGTRYKYKIYSGKREVHRPSCQKWFRMVRRTRDELRKRSNRSSRATRSPNHTPASDRTPHTHRESEGSETKMCTTYEMIWINCIVTDNTELAAVHCVSSSFHRIFSIRHVFVSKKYIQPERWKWNSTRIARMKNATAEIYASWIKEAETRLNFFLRWLHYRRWCSIFTSAAFAAPIK